MCGLRQQVSSPVASFDVSAVSGTNLYVLVGHTLVFWHITYGQPAAMVCLLRVSAQRSCQQVRCLSRQISNSRTPAIG